MVCGLFTMSATKQSKPPDWFTRAVAIPFEDRFVEVEGCRIHYLRWGKAGRPGLLLVHGGYAHAHWWDFIAPFFAEHYCVAALDLSGMGDSGYRSKYSGPLFAREVIEVCSDAGFAKRPVVVAHSFGAYVALQAAAIYGKELTGVILADLPFRPPKLQQEFDSKRRPVKRKEVYPDLATALGRFKLIPPQPCDNQFILEYIARHSLAKVKGGWTWKFDDQLFNGFRAGNVAEDLAKAACHVAAVYGQKSVLFPPEIVQYTARLLENRGRFVSIPGVHHHLFLEQPFAFMDVVRSLLAQWDGSATGRGSEALLSSTKRQDDKPKPSNAGKEAHA
jgi:pimeloyl-ACP methyl ester carboxylesterase